MSNVCKADPKKWPETTRTIRERFEASDDVLLGRLIHRVRQTLNAEGRDPELLTDKLLADSVERAYQPGKQRSAGLFLETVPEVFISWCRGPRPRLKASYQHERTIHD